MSRARNYRRIVLAIFRSKGPLTDAQLGWWARVGLSINESTAKKARRKLVVDGELRFARRVLLTEGGHVQKFWELAPKPR